MSDPIWLAEVLRAAGLKVDVLPGAMDRGHGDFGAIWGVVAHHTGSNSATANSIAHHPELGLCSQLHLGRDGKFTVCGVGIAWHAGQGSYPGLPANNANQVTIGIEAANDGGGSPGRPHRSSWPDAQYNAYVTGVAAILNKLGQPATHVIGHKEWAGAAQGKWDPGAIDMTIFRADVAREQTRLKTGTPTSGGTMALTPEQDIKAQLTGSPKPGEYPGWPQLGGRTLVDAVAALGAKLGVDGFVDPKAKK
ncbi:N-acetylmuramoyl-L-alanine amidase [Gordonia sp. PP30]|uniref:peptidoglycan recognition protein family protein n=1 Tax=Gordonia sp. PP30 TaxID=2935861 RepID=UPI001FFE89EE|nr:N-acetylmuramoyl-L-alanine amidase [Gordonia sp. PP30]UQE73832.1 N-acetylmuramoyl-L-alanine amidase [Gordonia sp. PP30]